MPRPATCSVVVPAHDEAAVLQDRLGALVDELGPDEAAFVVVANGCTDDTAAVARTLPGVRVVELDEPSKIGALNAGDRVSSVFPRVYLDADVRLDGPGLRRLAEALETDRPVVAAPRVRFDVSRSTWPVRAFYRVFEQLPFATEGFSGRGVYGLSEAARRRFDAFPDVVADDLFVERLFAPEERVVVDADSEVRAPRTLRALLAVRTRVARGNREIARRGEEIRLSADAAAPTGGGTLRALAGLVLRRPHLLPGAAVYVGVTLAARFRAARAAAGTAWERDSSTREANFAVEPNVVADPAAPPQRVVIDGIPADAVTHAGAVRHVMSSLEGRRGGRIVTPNLDIHRQARGGRYADLIDDAELIVADGMPLVWAARLQGQPLPERVSGATLVWDLARAAAAEGRSVFLLGAQPPEAKRAAARLAAEVPGLTVAGTYSPPFGFESSPEELRRITEAVRAADPDLVFVGLGFPKQERLMLRLRREVPSAWFIGCGGSIDFIAGRTRRAPELVQRLGLEWAFRLAQEPRRLFKRYVVHGLPHAAGLLTRAALSGLRGR